MRLGRFAAGLAVAGVATTSVRRAAAQAPPGGPERWTRTNHRGEPISLLAGPAVTAGLIAGSLTAGGSAGAVGTIAALGGGAFGLVDDLAEDTSTRTKGLKGHLGALAHGQLTTGGLKVLGIGATAVAAAVVGSRGRSGWGRAVDVGIDTALIAGTANLLNLLDLRPGRALKAAAVISTAMVGSPTGDLSGAVLGVAAATAPGDLAERDMLGDCGANALGAVLGAQLATGAPRSVRLTALTAVVGLTLASERISFSAVIEKNPVLRRLDGIGRRPVAPAKAGD